MSNINIKEITQYLSSHPSFQLDVDSPSFAILGKTGSGKSTLLNFLLGFKLQFQKKGFGYILKEPQMEDESLKRPKVGNLNSSCTECASLYFDEKKNPFFDCAGYFDTKGVNQEVINGIANSKIFEKGRKIKLILVIDFSSLMEAKGRFVYDFIQLLKRQFEMDTQNVAQSTLIVISKVNTSEVEIQEIYEYFQEIIEENTSMNEFCKLFLHIIIKNQNIVFFPIPNKKFNEQIEQIKAKLFNLNYTYLSSDAKVSMSDNALHSLLKLMNETEFQMKETSKKVSTELDSLYKSQIKTKCGQNYKRLVLTKNKMNFVREEKQIGQLLQSLMVSKQLRDQFISSFSIFKFCLKNSSRPKQVNCFEMIEGKVSELQSYHELYISKNSSEEKKNKLRQSLQAIERNQQKQFQKKVQEEKRKQQVFMKQIERQKALLEIERKEYERKNIQKLQKMKEQVRKKQIEAQRMEMQAKRLQQQSKKFTQSYQQIETKLPGILNQQNFSHQQQNPQNYQPNLNPQFYQNPPNIQQNFYSNIPPQNPQAQSQIHYQKNLYQKSIIYDSMMIPEQSFRKIENNQRQEKRITYLSEELLKDEKLRRRDQLVRKIQMNRQYIQELNKKL